MQESKRPTPTLRACVLGVGGYLPEKRVTNDALSLTLDTTDEWIRTRTGICARHIAAEGEYTSDLGTKAAQSAIADAKIDPAEIDLIILATTTPDDSFPSTACTIQAKLGLTRGVAFDVQAVCSGFTFALEVATSYLETGRAKTALVIGAETMSRLVDWTDRGTAVLFGDGAGAVILQAQEATSRGIIGTFTGSDGQHRDLLYTSGGISRTGHAGTICMMGRELFRHAVQRMSEVTTTLCTRHGIEMEEIDWLIPHQANIRIIDAVRERLAFPTEKVIVTLDAHANSSAASIPLAFHSAVTAGTIKRNDLILMTAFGGGVTWGGCLLRY